MTYKLLTEPDFHLGGVAEHCFYEHTVQKIADAAYAAGLAEGRKQIDPLDRSGMKDPRIVVISAVEVARIRKCLNELTATYPRGFAGFGSHIESADLANELLMRLAAAPEPKP